jgi:hypothetical protein
MLHIGPYRDRRAPDLYGRDRNPAHSLSLNLIKGFFSRSTRFVLRRTRVPSKLELKEGIMAWIYNITRRPVVHAWSYKPRGRLI